MCITSSSQVTLPFSLSCSICDAGLHIESPEQALAEGWIEIEEDSGGLAWNYLGLCPACQEKAM